MSRTDLQIHIYSEDITIVLSASPYTALLELSVVYHMLMIRDGPLLLWGHGHSTEDFILN